MYKKKAQSSFEFLMIFGIAFGIIMVLSSLFFGFFSSSKSELDREHIANIGDKMISTIEKVYFLGYGNRLTVNANFPDNIHNISIHHIDKEVDGEDISFDYINISYYDENSLESLFFEPNRLYIRFNYTNGTHDFVNNITSFKPEDYSGGMKKIRIENTGDMVEISYVK